ADVPFALIYLLAEQEQHLSLAAAVGLEPGSAAAPAVVALDRKLTDAAHGWPLAAVVHGSGAVLVDDLPERFGQLPGGGWPESPQQALLLPIAIPGQKRLLGVLVAAVSPHQVLDESYRGFLGLVAAEIAALGALEAVQSDVDFSLQEDEATVN